MIGHKPGSLLYSFLVLSTTPQAHFSDYRLHLEITRLHVLCSCQYAQNKLSALTSFIIKNLTASSHVTAEALTLLFNRTLTEDNFPSVWKTTHVTPIHKKGNKDTRPNYRPILLLRYVRKALEKCVQRHVLQFLITNHL